MGCDIHYGIVSRSYEPYNPDYNPWRTRCYHSAHLSRNYAMFAFLAGVRGQGEPIAKSRGWMTDDEGGVAGEVIDIFGYRIVSDTGGSSYFQSERIISSDWPSLDSYPRVGYKDSYIMDPDLHTPTWLTCEEYWQAIRRYREEIPDGILSPEYVAVGAYMRVMESAGEETRIILAFDN